MAVRYNATPRVAANPSEISYAVIAGDLGGLVGVRVVIDTALMRSKQDVIHALDKVQENLPLHVWPALPVVVQTILTEDGFSLTSETGDPFILE